MEVIEVTGWLGHEDGVALRDIQIRYFSDGRHEILNLSDDLSGIFIQVDYKDVLRIVKKERSKHGK